MRWDWAFRRFCDGQFYNGGGWQGYMYEEHPDFRDADLQRMGLPVPRYARGVRLWNRSGNVVDFEPTDGVCLLKFLQRYGASGNVQLQDRFGGVVWFSRSDTLELIEFLECNRAWLGAGVP